MKRRGADPAWLYFENGKWLADEARASTVVWIFQRAYAGRTAPEIVEELTEQGIPPISDRSRKGGIAKDAWDEKDVHTLLTNKRVYGDADYPQIVHQDTFDAVQLMRSSSPGGQQRSPNVFAGLLFCAECGKGLRLRTYPDRRIIECSDGHTGKWHYNLLEGMVLEQTFGHALFIQSKALAAEVRASEKEKKALLIRQRHSGLVRRAIDRIEVGRGVVSVIRRSP